MRLLRLTAILSAGAILAACGSGSGSSDSASGSGGESGGTTTLKVSETAGVPSSFLDYGKEQGFFSKRGIDLQIDTSVGGAAVVPGLVSGNLQIGGSNITSVLLAASKGLPIQMIAGGTYATTEVGKDFSALLVRPDSGISSPADLAGKKVAVNTLQNIGDITIKSSLDQLGVDYSGVQFLEAAFPDMLGLLKNGSVDAVWEIEPFVTIGISQGFEPVLWPYVQARPGLMVGSYMASKQYVQEHADVVQAFRDAVAETAKAIADDPDAFRQALPQITSIKAEAASAMTLPEWKGNVDVDSLDWMAEKMKEYGLVDKAIDVPSVVAPGAEG